MLSSSSVPVRVSALSVPSMNDPALSPPKSARMPPKLSLLLTGVDATKVLELICDWSMSVSTYKVPAALVHTL